MLTFRTLSAQPELRLELIEAGASESLDAELLWFHNTELADPSPYVRPTEAVLTNGLWVNSTAPADFVHALVRANAAGLIFGLTTDTPEVPETLVVACRQAQLPLFLLPTEVPFTAVTETAARIHSSERQEALAGMVRRSDALATSISRGAGMAGVLDVLRRDHELPFVVIDRSGREVASVGRGLEPDELEAAAVILGSPSPPLEVRLPKIGTVTLCLVKGAIDEVDAGLFCLMPPDQLSAAQLAAVEQAARFLSLEVAKQQAVQAIEARFSGELLEMILSGSARSGEVPDRLRAFGVDPHAPLAVITTAFGDEHAGATRAGATLPTFFMSQGLAVVQVIGSHDVVLIFGWNSDQDALTEFAHDLSRELERRHHGSRAVVGVGELCGDFAGLREPLIRSREACHVLRRRRGGANIATFAEVGTHTMLLGLHEPGVLRRFADDVLDPIRTNDRRYGTDLEQTLRTFLANDAQWVTTAAELFIHVNTLRNRIGRVSELTGRDLVKLEERVNLFLAIEADDMS